MNGWIKIHRKLLDSPLWTSSNAEGKVVLMTLLLSVTPTPYKTWWNGQEIMLRPGQMITSIEGLCRLSGLSVTSRNVRTVLEKAERCNFLTSESTNSGRLITIVNWGLYQLNNEQGDKRIDRQPTNARQSSDMSATTNREDKEEEKYREDKEVVVNACRHYQNCIGMVNGKIAEEIAMYENIMEPELVCEAINQAARQNAKWAYARAILERCKDNNILTLADFKAGDRNPVKKEKTAEELLRERGYI